MTICFFLFCLQTATVSRQKYQVVQDSERHAYAEEISDEHCSALCMLQAQLRVAIAESVQRNSPLSLHPQLCRRLISFDGVQQIETQGIVRVMGRPQ